LIEKGADIEAKTKDGETAFDVATKFGNTEISNLL